MRKILVLVIASILLFCAALALFFARHDVKAWIKPLVLEAVAKAKDAVYRWNVEKSNERLDEAIGSAADGWDAGLFDRFSRALPFEVWKPGNIATHRCSIASCQTYFVATNGNDHNSGLTPDKPFATFQKAVAAVRPGDTVLIKAGVYHQVLNVLNVAGGLPGRPITFGAYGDGPVVIDAAPLIAPSAWARVRPGIYAAQVSKTLDGQALPLPCSIEGCSKGQQPMAVVVDERALKPAPHNDASSITPGSHTWAYDGQTLTVDLGSRKPDSAQVDVVSQANPSAIYWYGVSNLVFNGLTARSSGAGGIWGYGNGITVSHCVSVFNTKAGINFMGNGEIANAHNQALYNLVYMNAMHNWPRGNNGFAAAGGGWSGGLVFSASERGLALGNVVVQNGGEGMIAYGSWPKFPSGHTVFERNLVMDNWSANVYIDNQPGDSVRNNAVYFSGYNTASWARPPQSGYPWSNLFKMNAGISIGDECNSSGYTPCAAKLADTQILNNLIVGFRVGVAEYAEGRLANPHGLKNTLIANNTIVSMLATPPNTYSAGIFLRDNGAANRDSRIVNNLVVTFAHDQPAVWYLGNGADPGVTIDHNAYYNPGNAAVMWTGSMIVRKLDLAQWQAQTGNDQQSIFSDPALVDLARLSPSGGTPYPYIALALKPGSPLIGRGLTLNNALTADFAGRPRVAAWNIGAF